MVKHLLSIAILTVLVTKALARQILSRTFPCCGYIGGQIYCYGGDQSGPSEEFLNVDTNIYSLNISQFSGQETDSMSDKWETIEPNIPFLTEKRLHTSAVVLPGGKFLFQGGYSSKTKLVNQTIVYDTNTNSWQAGLPYTETNHGIKQIYRASGIYLPNKQAVGFYGGMEQFPNISIPETTTTGKTIPFWSNDTRSHVGFKSIQMYSSESMTWLAFSPQPSTPADYYPYDQSATLDPYSGKVYFFGGNLYNLVSNKEDKVTFSSVYTFNTVSGVWLKEALGGTPPGDRIYHSVDLLPNSRHILLYGGTYDESKAIPQYCYTLNLENNTWTEQTTIGVPSAMSGPRFSHASVLVNTTLFVFFGQNLDGVLATSILSFNVADVTDIFYAPIFNPKSVTAVPSSSGISNGAIGGIVAGVVVVVLAIAAAIIYRKQKSAKNKNLEEQVNIDWDRIDEQFKEVPIVDTNSSPQSKDFTVVDSYTSQSPHSKDATIVDTYTSFSPHSQNVSIVNNNISYSPHSKDKDLPPANFSSITASDINFVKPSIDINDISNTSVPKSYYATIKPDGN